MSTYLSVTHNPPTGHSPWPRHGDEPLSHDRTPRASLLYAGAWRRGAGSGGVNADSAVPDELMAGSVDPMLAMRRLRPVVGHETPRIDPFVGCRR